MRILAIDPSIRNIGVAWLDYDDPNVFVHETRTFRIPKQITDKQDIATRYAELWEFLHGEFGKLRRRFPNLDLIVIERPPNF